jgi:hypothetical protein
MELLDERLFGKVVDQNPASAINESQVVSEE